MTRRLDRILVVDVESTCWEGEPPSGQMSEIIEIGLCVVDVAALERVERRSILVRPACSAVSAYCTQLTTLTQADVDAGTPLVEACRVLVQEYQSGQRPFASFGDYDRQQFERNCAVFGIPYPFGPTHLNVKNLAAVASDRSRRSRSCRSSSRRPRRGSSASRTTDTLTRIVEKTSDGRRHAMAAAVFGFWGARCVCAGQRPAPISDPGRGRHADRLHAIGAQDGPETRRVSQHQIL